MIVSQYIFYGVYYF